MLKWLRKYNTWILVVGGVLLMIAFLMPQAIQEIGKRRLTGPMFKFDGGRVNAEQMSLAAREWEILSKMLVAANPMQAMRPAESPEHWIMLTNEAQQAGLVGGPQDGSEMVSQLVEARANFDARFMGNQTKMADLIANVRKDFDAGMMRMAGSAGLNETQVMQAWAKLKGVLRMKILYGRAPRYSDRRLILGAERLDTAGQFEYVLIPAEREMAGIAQPAELEIQAHFDKYKNVEPETGEFGFGYQLPDRVKIEWITLSRDVVKQSITPDSIEVEKRFLKQYPQGTVPAGIDEASERTKIENAVITEQVDKVMKTAEQAVRAELDRAKSRLASDGDYKVLPADWAATRPNFDAVAQVVVDRVKERHEIILPKAGVNRETKWVTAKNVGSLPGLGASFMRVGSRNEPFTKLPFLVKELEGSKALFFQTGLAVSDALDDNAGNRYFFMVTEARKTSAPDALSDARDSVVRDLKRQKAYERLLTKLDSIHATASAEKGLEAVAAPDPNADGEASKQLTINKGSVDSRGFSPPIPSIDTPESKRSLLAIAMKLDPTKDPAETPITDRTVVLPVARSLGIVAARVISVSPVTAEKLRTMGGTVAREMQSEELPRTMDNDPFSFKAMRARMNFEYLDDDMIKRDKARQSGEKSADQES